MGSSREETLRVQKEKINTKISQNRYKLRYNWTLFVDHRNLKSLRAIECANIFSHEGPPFCLAVKYVRRGGKNTIGKEKSATNERKKVQQKVFKILS